MIFKPLNLARQSLVKTFTHSYAQSLVAVTHPSSAPHNHTVHTLSNNVVGLFGRPPPATNAKNQNVANSSTAPSAGGAGAKARQLDTSSHDGGLAAYYAAWQNHHKPEDKEWHEFQFAKRIGWKAPTTIPEGPAKQTQNLRPTHVRTRSGVVLERANSTSALDDLKKEVESQEAEKAAAEQEEFFSLQDNEGYKSTADQQESSAQPANTSSEGDSQTWIDSAESTFSSGVGSASDALSTAATSVSEGDVHTEQLARLAETQRYAEIPPAFSSLLAAGIKPTAAAYNALLLSAINLTPGKHQVVPKALDIYSDMRARRVNPDTATYAILIELLAARSLHVAAMTKELEGKRLRYGGMDEQEAFMFNSDQTEFNIVAEDDSVDNAIKLFDIAAAITSNHLFPAETYRMLISACAERGSIGDLIRVYAQMEGQGMVPPSEIFAPMMQAFASTGDLKSAVECYDEYKTLAIAHDEGSKTIDRKDEDVYAAVVRAYLTCGRTAGGLKFLGKIEDELKSSQRLSPVRDAVAVQALYPQWMQEGRHDEALQHAVETLSFGARKQALSAICVDAADKNYASAAVSAYQLLAAYPGTNLATPISALLAMHIRTGNLLAAQSLWTTMGNMAPVPEFVDPSTMYTLSHIGYGEAEQGLRASRSMFSRIRSQAHDQQTKTEVVDRVDEAIEVMGKQLLRFTPVPSPSASMILLWAMVENGTLATPLAERLLVGLGPETIAQLSMVDLNMLMQTQSSILSDRSHLDVAHVARFTHMMDILGANMLEVDQQTQTLVARVLNKLDRSDLTLRWQSFQYQASTPQLSPVQFRPRHMSANSLTPMAYEDAYDPYGSSTDFKGSNAIAEELDKTYGKHSLHLNEALIRFKNMRRAGRHPRYVTYAKLISAAAKENRLPLAQDILAMAKQDVPLVANSRVVRQGWISILDSMVGACLTVGQRDLADQFHHELLHMNAAPSANTFGLYITTLKESTRTFDEATEAVKIFQRAKNEGVEPTSFLYNALIGKLGKARRIDDCLFYFAEMRNLGIRPTSVTYGTVVNALCRVSDDKFAEELFEEMESMPNYKPRPAPYNSLMQYFLTTKRDRSKVIAYYERMKAKNIPPTMHTYKLLIDTYATLEPIDMPAAEKLLAEIPSTLGARPEAVHYASLIHAKGCVNHDMPAARALFDSVISEQRVPPQASLYQALFEAMVANHEVAGTEELLQTMTRDHNVPLTPYIANTLIHGWAMAGDISKAKAVFDKLGKDKREPSTYEAMTRAYLAVEDHGNAMCVVGEALRRGYPTAVANKICELVGGGGGSNIGAPTPAKSAATSAPAIAASG